MEGVPFDDTDTASVIWDDFTTKLDALAVEPAAKEGLLEAARSALLSSVKPAYERLIEVVQSQQEVAPADDGVWRFPDGDAFYANRLRAFTTTDLTPEEIHQAGLANVERLHREMRAVMAELGERGNLADFLNRVRNDASLRFDNTDKGRAAYLDAARAAIDGMAKRLPDYFGLLPASDLIVKPVEAYRERSAGKAFTKVHRLTALAPAFTMRIFTTWMRCLLPILRHWPFMRVCQGIIYSCRYQPSLRNCLIFSVTPALPLSPRVGVSILSISQRKWAFTKARIQILGDWRWSSGGRRGWSWTRPALQALDTGGSCRLPHCEYTECRV